MFWRCGCGHHNFLHHTYCAPCGQPKPPPAPPKGDPKKTGTISGSVKK